MKPRCFYKKFLVDYMLANNQCLVPCFYVIQYLDENQKLILATLDNQNLGKLAECAR